MLRRSRASQTQRVAESLSNCKKVEKSSRMLCRDRMGSKTSSKTGRESVFKLYRVSEKSTRNLATPAYSSDLSRNKNYHNTLEVDDERLAGIQGEPGYGEAFALGEAAGAPAGATGAGEAACDLGDADAA